MFAQARRSESVRMGPEAKALDAWLRRSLADRFEKPTAEALPGELAALLARFEN